MAQAKHTGAAWKDPIVEEVRAAREVLFAACEYDLEALATRLREAEIRQGRASVSYSKRKPSETPA
jgi:hypothetical protein